MQNKKSKLSQRKKRKITTARAMSLSNLTPVSMLKGLSSRMTSARYLRNKVRALCIALPVSDQELHFPSAQHRAAAHQQPPNNHSLSPSLNSAVGKFAPSMQRTKTHFLPKTLQLKFAGVAFNTSHLDNDITKPGL